MKRVFRPVLAILLLQAALFSYRLMGPVKKETLKYPATESVPPAPANPRSVPAPLRPPPPLQAEFKNFTEQVLAQLPTSKQLQNLSDEELHHTPKLLIDGGAKIGEVTQKWVDDPKYKRTAATFYHQCTLKDELPKVLRALCYSHLRDLRSTIGEELYRDNRYPESIMALAEYVRKSRP